MKQPSAVPAIRGALLLAGIAHDLFVQAGFMTHRRSLIAAGIIIPVLAASIWMRDAEERLATVHIETPNGELVVELADTPTSRSSGLAGRGALGSDGVLLKWTEPARHPIWMKGMRFPLDLLWIDGTGVS